VGRFSFHKESVCHNCNGRDHLAIVCKKAKEGTSSRTTATNGTGKKRQHVRQVEGSDESEGENWVESLCQVEEVGSVKCVYQPPIQVSVSVDDIDVSMELDTGAAVSIMSAEQCKQLWPGRSLGSTTVKLQT